MTKKESYKGEREEKVREKKRNSLAEERDKTTE